MHNDVFNKCVKFTSAREVMAAGVYPYFKRVESAQGPVITVEGKKKVVCCSNNYLGLADNAKVIEASIEAAKKYGTSCTGSRFLNGTNDLHEKVERKFARFVGKESAILFTTGHHANLGAISVLVGKNDVVITDKLDHASIIDGCRLSFGEVKKYRHNDMDALEIILEGIKEKNKLIIVDGVFSMEGDIADLPAIVKLAKAYGARIMLDDAHAVGILGDGGRGTAEHFGLENEVDLIMGTHSKSLAAIGGFIAGPSDVISWIKHLARSMIFSASLPPALVASASTALDIIEEQPELRARLWRNTHKMLKGYRTLGYDTGTSETPIIPIVIKDTMKTYEMCRLLFENGVFVNAVISPAVPQGRELLRTSYMATHTEEQLDRVLAAFAKVGTQVGVI